jgi:CheY-like chemotaxis protein
MLPEMDGFELCRRVKTDNRLRTIPFIFYSAVYVEKKDEELALQLGASRFLLKPLKPADFIRVIDEVIEEHQMKKLPVPDRPLAAMHDLDRMQLEAVARKLEQKVQELARERDALKKSEQKYQQLTETLEERIKVDAGAEFRIEF